MKKSLLIKMLCAIGLCFISLSSLAALINRGGGLINDTVLDATWMQDANLLFEPPGEICPPEFGGETCFPVGGSTGAVTFEEAASFVETLTFYDEVRDVTYDDWRLPTMSPINGSAFQTNFTNDASSDEGYAETTTNGTDGGWRDAGGKPVSELGHMFYVNLANQGSCTPNNASPASCVAQPGSDTENYDVFLNLEKDPSTHFNNNYWTGTPTGAGKAGYQNFNSGFQGRGDTEASGNADYLYVWALRDGDVSPVPVPAAVWLFAGGLFGLIKMARRKKA